MSTRNALYLQTLSQIAFIHDEDSSKYYRITRSTLSRIILLAVSSKYNASNLVGDVLVINRKDDDE